MSKPLSIGYSPCPNDTFIFYALVHGLVDCEGVTYRPPFLEDVETLNGWALQGKLDITKLSCHALGHVLDEYSCRRQRAWSWLRSSGGGSGDGCA